MIDLNAILATAKDEKEVIQKYLDEFSKEDPQVKEGLQNEKKDINECWDFIVNKAKKELNGKNGFLNPNTVFGWAIHYYTEEKEKIDEELKLLGASKTKTKEAETEKKEEPKKSKKVEDNRPKVEQVSIFDL